jgi:hypothetical protein
VVLNFSIRLRIFQILFHRAATPAGLEVFFILQPNEGRICKLSSAIRHWPMWGQVSGLPVHASSAGIWSFYILRANP